VEILSVKPISYFCRVITGKVYSVIAEEAAVLIVITRNISPWLVGSCRIGKA